MTNPATSTKLPKAERLCRRTHIELLIKNGERLYKGRWIVARFAIIEEKSEIPIQVLFSAGKRKLKKAVHRNRAKRVMRECYRLSKPLLATLPPVEGFYALHLIYLRTELPVYQEVFADVQAAVKLLATPK